MSRTSRRRVVGAVPVFAIAAGLLVSGCGQMKAGAAALVEDERIAVAELSQTVEATEQAADKAGLRVSDQASLVRGELSRMINTVVLDAAAEKAGITVSRGDVQQRIAQAGGRKRLEQQALRQFAVPPEDLRRHVRDQVIRQRLAGSLAGGSSRSEQSAALVEALRKTAREMDIAVSPRYGKFSTNKLTVVPDQSELSTPDSGGDQAGFAPPGSRG